MGLVLGISVCVGGVYAVNKTRKKMKKKRKQKKLAEEEEANQFENSGEDDVEDSGCDSGLEEGEIVHSAVVTEHGYSSSVRKRNRVEPGEETYCSENAKPDKTSSHHKMTKLQEESEELPQHPPNHTGHRDSVGSSSKGTKSHKTYKHLHLEESISDDEYEKRDVTVVSPNQQVEERSDDVGYHSEEIHQVSRDMRMSIRVGEKGNTIFKIYKTDNEKKKPSTELRSTTNEITV